MLGGFLQHVVFTVVHKSLCDTKRHVLCPIIPGLWGLYNLNYFSCWRKWFALYYQIWETC